MTKIEVVSVVAGLNFVRALTLGLGPILGALLAMSSVPLTSDWFLPLLAAFALVGALGGYVAAAPIRGLAAIVVLLDRIADKLDPQEGES